MTVAAKALPGVRLLLAWGLVLGGTSPFFAQQDDPLPRRMLGQVNAAGAVVYTMDARGLATGGLTAEDNPQQTQTGMAGTYDAEALVRNAARGREDALLHSQESMQFIARETGGFAVADTNDLNLGLRRVLEDQQGYYLLGYTAPQDAPRSGWDQNRVKVRIKRPGLPPRAAGLLRSIRSDRGEEAWGRRPDERRVVAFLLDRYHRETDRGVRHDARNGGYVRSVLFLDTNDLRFDEAQPGRHTATFQLAVLAIGDNGRARAVAAPRARRADRRPVPAREGARHRL